MCQHHHHRNNRISLIEIRDNEKEVRFVTVYRWQIQKRRFSSAKRDVSTTKSPIKRANLAREKYLCARMRRRISVRDVAYQSSHQNTLLIIRAKIIFFAVLALKTRRLGLYLKRAIGVRNRRRGYPREPKETKIITHSRTLEVIFAEATVEVVKENILYSCRCVCVCWYGIEWSNFWPGRRDQNERKKRSSELVKNTRRKILDGGDGSIIALLSLDHHPPHLLIFKSS